jgi:hypothetical protein
MRAVRLSLLAAFIGACCTSSGGTAQRPSSFTDGAKGPYWIMPMPPTGQYIDTCLLVRARNARDTAKTEFIILRMLTDCSALDGPR